jgi:uncharacterized protein DUF6600
MRPLAAFLAVALLAPAVRADDWYEDDAAGGPSYDVSVDVNGSGAATLESFQAPLSPYGEWVVAPGYGQVWRPRVAPGWRPYYYGRWEWTNEGWLWVSDEPYGWAVYHYGRWAHDPYYGWIWVPGYEWAPAWVSWRASGDVVGWAPLAPGLSVYVSSYPFVDFYWTFVPTVRFVSVPVYSVAYAPTYTRQWFQRTAPAPARPAPAPGVRPAPAPAPAWGGPAPRFVAERIGRPLTPARIVQAPSPGARGRPGEIAVFRPGPAPARSRAPDAPRAPGWGGSAPPQRADGRGPGAAPAQAPGWNGRERAPGWGRPEPQRGAPPPVYRGQPPRQAAPAYRPQPPRQAAPAFRPEPPRQGPPPAQAPAPAPRGGGRGEQRQGGGGGQHRR